MSTVIRPATVADVAAILTIYNDAVETTTASWDLAPVDYADRLARYEAAQANGWPLLVAEIDGTVVGFASYGPFRTKDGFARTMEHSVYLDAAARGRGLGRALMVELIERARANGVHALIGGIDGANEVSVRLHESLGFAEVGRLPQVGAKFGRWLDLVFLELLLDDAATP